MTGSPKWFSSLNPHAWSGIHYFQGNNRGKIVSYGAIQVNENFVLKDVALVKNFRFNLLSISQLLEDGFECTS